MKIKFATATNQKINPLGNAITYGVKPALRTAKLFAAPLRLEADWNQRLRNVQQSIGGWGCELLELRRCDRIVPMWRADFPTLDFTFSDAD
ncbi:MAG: hypothetical protein RL692_1435 [Planctomycetota bacterium]